MRAVEYRNVLSLKIELLIAVLQRFYEFFCLQNPFLADIGPIEAREKRGV